ncbi:U-box domain-containing protein 3 [Linum perenne]
MADFGSNMVDKAAYVLSVLVSVPEARSSLVEEAGIPVLVEIVEVGSQRQKEIAVSILLQLCEDNLVYRAMVAREGAIPPLVALSQSGTNRAKQKVKKRSYNQFISDFHYSGPFSCQFNVSLL